MQRQATAAAPDTPDAGRWTQIFDYPYHRLPKILGQSEYAGERIALHVGEPGVPPPAFLAEIVAEQSGLWGKYPLGTGTPDYLQSVADWLTQRYGFPSGLVDPGAHVVAYPGSKEGLFNTALAAVMRKERDLPAGQRPVILIPSPGYHVYFGGSLLAGADIVPLPLDEENGFLPHPEALPAEIMQRTALLYLCTPHNPCGSVIPMARLKELVTLARAHDFVLVSDECYSEIYFEAPPPSILEAAAALDGSFDNVLSLNSLSKRSGAPGLRCGFGAGDAELITVLGLQRGYVGTQVPGPNMAAGAALWRDEAHVVEARAFYAEGVAVAEEVFGGFAGYSRPEGGFFLWLKVGDGEAFARRLWQEQGVSVLPGSLMSRPYGECPCDARPGTPGDDYIRFAVMHEPEKVREAARRVAALL